MRPRMPSVEQVRPFLEMMDAAGVYSNFGPLVTRLEAAYAAKFNVPENQVVTVSSATLGIEGAVRTTRVSKWFVPDFTFPATGLAVLEADRHLVLSDVESQTWEIDRDELPSLTGESGVIPVMAFGAPINLDPWRSAENVIIDAAASLGASHLDLSSLPETWAVVFSLHATKVLPAGEGGIVVFGDAERARSFRAWSNFGFRGTRISTVEGTNAKMSEIHAAYGLASLAAWEQEKSEWFTALVKVRELTKELSLNTSRQDESGVHPYWVVDVGSAEVATSITQSLDRHGIGYRFWWPSLQSMPAFAGIEVVGGLSNSQRLSSSVVGLPMFRGISNQQLERVAALIGESMAVS